MSQQSEIRAVINRDRKNIKKMRKIVSDTESLISFTALQVLIFSLCFIFTVFGFHLVSRFIPSIKPSHLFTAVVVLSVASFISILRLSNK